MSQYSPGAKKRRGRRKSCIGTSPNRQDARQVTSVGFAKFGQSGTARLNLLVHGIFRNSWWEGWKWKGRKVRNDPSETFDGVCLFLDMGSEEGWWRGFTGVWGEVRFATNGFLFRWSAGLRFLGCIRGRVPALTWGGELLFAWEFGWCWFLSRDLAFSSLCCFQYFLFIAVSFCMRLGCQCEACFSSERDFHVWKSF